MDHRPALDLILYSTCVADEKDGIITFQLDLHCATATIKATRIEGAGKYAIESVTIKDD